MDLCMFCLMSFLMIPHAKKSIFLSAEDYCMFSDKLWKKS